MVLISLILEPFKWIILFWGFLGKVQIKYTGFFFHAQHPVSMGRFKEHLATSSFHIRLFVPVALCAHNSLCLTAKWSRWESISQGQIWLVIKSWSTLLPFYQDKYLAKNFLILASLSGILGPSQQAYVQRQSASQEAERDLQSKSFLAPWHALDCCMCGNVWVLQYSAVHSCFCLCQ